MPHRILAGLTLAFALVLNVAPKAQRATPPPGIAGRTTIPGQMTVVSGSLTGTVRDRSQALISGIQVTVILETEANVVPHRTQTDKEGRFRFTGLPLGTYCLIVSQGSSDLTKRTGIRVRGAQPTNVPIVLSEPVPTSARERLDPIAALKATPNCGEAGKK